MERPLKGKTGLRRLIDAVQLRAGRSGACGGESAFRPAGTSPSSLRIAIVTETYPPEINGVAMTTGRMVEGLLAEGHHVQLIRPRQHRTERPAARRRLEEVLALGMPIPRYPGLKLGLPAPGMLLGRWSRERPHVVNIVTEGPLGWSALTAARKLRLPVVSEFHTNFHHYSRHYGAGWLDGAIAAYLRRFHARSDATLVPTEAMRRALTEQGYQRLRVVSRGVDTRLFHPERRSEGLRRSWGVPVGEIAALYVGRLAPEKNLQLAVSAFEAIRAQRPTARMIWVGDGPARARLAARYPDHVFAGVREGEDLASHYASADLFLFPSMTETYGNVTAEALASGLPVVAFDYAAAAELVRSGRNGWLAPFADDAAFVAAAVRCARNVQHAADVRRAARLSVEPLAWEEVVADLSRVLRETAETHGDRPETEGPG